MSQAKRKIKILFTGGGSGGHIYPIAAVIQELNQRKADMNIELFYAGPKDLFCDAVLSQEGVKIKHILAGKIRRYFNPLALLENIIDLFVKTPLGLIQAFFILFFTNPDVIYSKGGYGSFPVVACGWMLGIPVFLQESDIIPGKASRSISKYAVEIFVSFPKTEFFPLKKTILVGNPVRRSVFSGYKQEAVRIFGLKSEKPVILVFGGSQGSKRINDKILDVLPDLLCQFEVIHQTGERNLESLKKEVKQVIGSQLSTYYHPIGFFDHQVLPHALAGADLIISRAGSGSIFEIAAAKKPSIIIPLPESAQNHQVENAYSYAKTGAALVIEEENFTSNFFLGKIKDLFENTEKLHTMSKAAENFSRPKSASIISEYILNYLTK